MPRRFDLLPFKALRAIAFILAIGAEKHGEETWREVPAQVHIDAALSHLAYWLSGQRNDPDTEQSHLWNAATRILFVIEQEIDAAA